MPQLMCYDSNNFLVIFALINRMGRKYEIIMSKKYGKEKKEKKNLNPNE